MCHNRACKMTPHPPTNPCQMRHFQIFDKIDSFPNNVSNVLDDKKGRLNFLSAIAAMQLIFWTEDNFSFISGYRHYFNCKLKKLTNRQIIIFYSPSNAPCSSDKSVQIKHLKHYNFINIQHPIRETFTKKNSLQNLIRFHGGLFDLKILEISTTVFWLKLLFEIGIFSCTAQVSP